MSPKALLLIALLLLTFVYTGCEEEQNEAPVEAIEYSSTACTEKTNRDGKLDVKTHITSEGQEYDLGYEFEIVDDNGNPIEGINLTYGQHNGKSIIYIYDEKNRYASTFFIGSPRELKDYFESGTKKSGPYTGKGNSQTELKSSEAIVTMTIVALVTLTSIAVAEVGIILNAYKIDKFMLTDYVTETEDYILYCKTFEEIGQLIESRTQIVLNLTSIFVSYATLGTGSGSNAALELAKGAGSFTASNIRDELLHHAIDEWEVSMDDLVGRKVAVKVFPFEEDEQFSEARNLFATYEIDLHNSICNGSEECVKGTIRGATNNEPIEGALVKLEGEQVSVSDFTDEEGEYSFFNIDQGDYTVEVSKDSYISEEKEIFHDGTVSQVNFVLSDVIASGQYRFVLTWGEKPLDLDIHLYTVNDDHIYYFDMGSQDSYPHIYLDRDDINSYGPETITMEEFQASSIYVHNYSGEIEGDVDIKESGAEVRVYRGDSNIGTYQVPDNGSGYWWYVLDINQAGVIEETNYILDDKKKLKLPEKEAASVN
jgi:uncharacterized protein YfaP (DUF2135 family)